MKITKNKTYQTLDELVVARLKKNPKRTESFLNRALKEYQEDGDEKALFIALKQVALAKGGFNELSKKTGLSRESLYKTLSINGNPKFQTVKIILNNLGYAFTIKPTKKLTKAAH